MKSLTRSESGIALVTAILVLMLVSGLMAGMFAAQLASQRSHATDRDQSVAYAAAHAGLEKLTAGLAGLFVTDFSPNAGQIAVVDGTPPAIAGFTYTAPGGLAGSGYDITFTPIPAPLPFAGDPQALPDTDITTGPFEGFKGLITKYELTVTARSTTGNSEVRLRRELQTVAVPVFQFGIFGEKSLGFHAGPSFDFGGRVHTNQTLYLAQGSGNVLTFRDKITAFTQVVRNQLSNGSGIGATGHTGSVSIPTVIGGAPATYRNLADTEGSGTTAAPAPLWKNLSEVTYHTNIRTEATGAKQLNLPLTSNGAQPIDLIRRPATANENVANAIVFGQRYFAQASLRILLSDRAADITNLPTVTADPPLNLEALGAAGYVGPPLPMSATALEARDAVNGTSLVRVRDFPAAGAIRFETAASSAGPWAGVDVPQWLKWQTLTYGPLPGVPLTCPTLTGTQLSGCLAHPALGGGTQINFNFVDGTTFSTTVVAGGAALDSATINLVAAFTTARNFVATRNFFIGEDPVVCTGFTQTRVTGCTSPNAPAATALAAGDPVYSGSTTSAPTPLLSGFIKIERQNAPNVVPQWTDVTLEWLNYGIAGRNQQGDDCGDPTPNAIIRLMRLRDNGHTANLCGPGAAAPAVSDYSGSLNSTDFWPNLLFDAREGSTRLRATSWGMDMGGLFSYVAFDGDNFRQWAARTGAFAAGTGNQMLNNNGYIIYFSDRRGDHDETNGDVETGEYGHEDSINPANAAWASSLALEAGENFNESGVEFPVDNPLTPETLQTYGETPSAVAGVVHANVLPNIGFDANQRPWTTLPRLYTGRARLARPVLFRRALKVINGGLNQLPTSGIAITAENPIYIQGNFNATAASVVAEPNVPASVIGDSITLLSGTFRDTMTFQFPNDQASRNATTTGYRFAMVTGKAIPFPKPGWAGIEWGSDGGVHNFMKMLEDWGGQTLRYRGSMVSLYYSRQAIGIYRADANIYSPPTRNYNFDTDFLTPALLPPGTPMFRDINTLKFRQILRPNQ